MSKLLDTDYLLVNRNNQTYKIQASDFPTTGGSKPITPDANEVQFNPTVSGNGSLSNPFKLTTSICDYGKSVTSNEEVIIINQSTGSLVYFTDIDSEVNGIRYDNPVGIIGADDADYTTRLLFTDTPQSIIDGTFTGLLKVAETEIYIKWTVNVEASAEPPTLNSVQLTATGNGINRFTNQSFKTTLDVDEGQPVSTKSIAYKVEGNLFTQAESDEITAVNNMDVPGGWTYRNSNNLNTENATFDHVLVSDGNQMVGFGRNPNGSYSDQIFTNVNVLTNDWVRRSSRSMSLIYCLMYGDGMFVAGGSGNGLIYSSNGTNWTDKSHTADDVKTVQCAVFAENQTSRKYLMMNSGNNAIPYSITSSNGTNWTYTKVTPAETTSSVAYSPTLSRWVRTSNNTRISYSSNTTSWSPATINTPIGSGSMHIVWGGDKFIAKAEKPDDNSKVKMLVSYDGITWDEIPGTLDANNLYYLSYSNNRWYYSGNTTHWSDDGLYWTETVTANVNRGCAVIGWDPKNNVWVGTGNSLGGVGQDWCTSEYGIDSSSSLELELASEKELADFNVGEPVVQNDGNAAGIISEITPNGTSSTITLTNEQGTWLENSGTTVLGPPKQGNTATTAYLELNNSRQVINLSKNPVFHISTDPEDNISFDVPPPTGQTWDFELPDGTTIQSQAFVDNSSAGPGGERSPDTGTIDSNIIQPGGNPFSYRSLTEEELNRSIVLFESRELRTEKYRQDLVTREALLRSNLEDQGFSSTLINDVLNAY